MPFKSAGLDIGSRSVELVVLAGDERTFSAQIETTPHVEEDCARLLAQTAYDRLTATGYGRSLAEIRFGAESVTEIRAYAVGAGSACPGCAAVLDIGGQDTKAIALDDGGRVARFEMNDRCAAGAGRFLEMIARALGLPIDELAPAGLRGSEGIKLSSMCAVFAESEVVGLLTRGANRDDLARAAHGVVADRAIAMLERVRAGAPVVFGGGVARNDCLLRILEKRLGRSVLRPEEPVMLGAFGAALIGTEPEVAKS